MTQPPQPRRSRRGRVEAASAGDLAVKIRMSGLRPGGRHRYTVEQGALHVDGEFVTAPAPSTAAPVTFAWSGDLGSRTACRHVTDGYPIFRVLARRALDFFLFVGDTIYADQVCEGPDRVPGSAFVARTLREFRAKHRYNRARPAGQGVLR